MKKPLIFLLLLVSSIAFASSSFDYELIRTKEAPGFFMTKIFATNLSKPLKSREIFVKNFPKSEEKIYRELFPFLQQQRQARIVPIEEFNIDKINQEKDVVVFLGERIGDNLNFKYNKEADIFLDFQNFAKKNLSPIVLKNLKKSFGGNVFDVQTKQSQITVDSPAIFIGKFSKPMKTRMEINGEVAEKSLKLETVLDLSKEENTQDSTAQFLPELWNDLANPKTTSEAVPRDFKLFFKKAWQGILPLFIGLIVLIVLWITAKYLIKMNNNHSEEDFIYEEEVPIFHPQISEEEYESYEEKLEEAKEELPFEVIWKQ